jgi:hypothetical protein
MYTSSTPISLNYNEGHTKLFNGNGRTERLTDDLAYTLVTVSAPPALLIDTKLHTSCRDKYIFEAHDVDHT